MSTRINWTNPNATFSEIRIYRTDAPFDAANIPASPIVTLTEGTTWLDTTTLQNVYYYYTIGIVVNGDLLLSPPKKTIHMPYTGPGPQELQCGDWTRGYFGVVNPNDLFTTTELCAMCSVSSPNATAAIWAKFIRNGKILFINLHPTNGAKTVSWNTLYNLGLMYGTDDFGPPTGHGLASQNQRKVVTRGEHSFVVRQMRALDTLDYSVGQPTASQGEAYPLLSAVMNNNVAGADVLSDFLRSTYFIINDYTPLAEFTGTTCMHLNPTGDVQAANTNCIRTQGCLWRPVLELVL